MFVRFCLSVPKFFVLFLHGYRISLTIRAGLYLHGVRRIERLLYIACTHDHAPHLSPLPLSCRKREKRELDSIPCAKSINTLGSLALLPEKDQHTCMHYVEKLWNFGCWGYRHFHRDCHEFQFSVSFLLNCLQHIIK